MTKETPIRVQPGERVILTSPDHLTQEQASQIRRRWEEVLPDVPMLLVAGMSVVVLPRPPADPNPFPHLRLFRWLP